MVKTLKRRPKIMKSTNFISMKLTEWIGTPQSVLLHTLLFIGIFALGMFGFSTDQILLLLTTAVSLEAIYLAIFIQMTVNRNTKSLEEVEADIDEIQEDVEDLEEDVEDLEVIHTKNKDIKSLSTIEAQLQKLLDEVTELKKQKTASV